ncbi:MAG: leucine zipper domain-containing protein [Xenophilus sp.]
MNTHRNARLTYLRRLEMVQDMTERGMCASQTGAKHGVSAVTSRKWHNRYLARNAQQLLDKSSRPTRSPRMIEPSVGRQLLASTQPKERVPGSACWAKCRATCSKSA